jgi:GNAT superfamily N-acetyltransferase
VTDPALVRRAHPVEHPALAALQLRTALAAFGEIFPPSAPKPTLLEMVNQWRELLCDPAEELGETAAFVIGAPGKIEGVAVSRRCGPIGSLERVYVDPDHWGLGHGSRLHDAAVEWLAEAGCTRAELWTLERNALSRRWYERRGWQLIDGRLDIWPDGDVFDVRYRLFLQVGPCRRRSR